MIRIQLLVLGALLSSGAWAGDASLQKLWQTDAVLKVPESVRYDAQRQVLYVSNIAGTEPWADDGNGSIGRIALDGSVIDVDWVTGLNGPKGMGLLGDMLYVADINDVVSIDVETGEIKERLEVPGALAVNDLSVAADGTIYITDSNLGRIQKLVNGHFTTLIEGLAGLNGVLHSQGELLFLADGGLWVLDDTGNAQSIATGMEGNVDGVERIDDDSWLVSCWKGTVYYVTRSGQVSLLLDSRPEEINAADLGYDPVNRIAYVPEFWKNTVAAYQLTVD